MSEKCHPPVLTPCDSVDAIGRTPKHRRKIGANKKPPSLDLRVLWTHTPRLNADPLEVYEVAGESQKSNRKVPTLQAIEPCDSKTAPTAEIDSRSSPYQFFTVDCLTAAL